MLFDSLALTRPSERSSKLSSGSAINLKGCRIQMYDLHNRFEVVIKNYTKINKYSASFTIEDVKAVGTETIILSQLPSLKE